MRNKIRFKWQISLDLRCFSILHARTLMFLFLKQLFLLILHFKILFELHTPYFQWKRYPWSYGRSTDNTKYFPVRFSKLNLWELNKYKYSWNLASNLDIKRFSRLVNKFDSIKNIITVMQIKCFIIFLQVIFHTILYWDCI